MKRRTSSIEPLEGRIAPAAVVTFTDLDGDLVTVSSSKGTHDQLVSATGGAAGLDDHMLQMLDLTGTADFDGATISITATPKNGLGDGFVNVGYINATGRVLGSVTVDGDLGVIDVGNLAKNAFALQKIAVHSMGMVGTATGAPPGLQSDIAGSVKAINVKTDVSDVFVLMDDPSDNVEVSLGALTIGGSLRAPTSTGMGIITVGNGKMGSVKIGGSMVGGASDFSAMIRAGSISSVSIGGDVIGGAGYSSALIYGATGNVTIGGDLRGGDTSSIGSSGLIRGFDMGNLKIGGSVIGSPDASCGTVLAFSVKNVTVGGSLTGSDGPKSGAILSDGNIGNVTIGADVNGGAGDDSGSVRAIDGNIGNVTIRGTLDGGAGLRAGSILASTPAGTHGKLGSVKIGGSLFGGGNKDLAGAVFALNGMGAVSVGRDISGGQGYIGGSIYVANGSMGSVFIHDAIYGGSGQYSGAIYSGGTMGAVTIGGNLAGYTGDSSGFVFALKIPSVTVGDSLFGGAGPNSGTIQGNDLGTVNVRGDAKGGKGQLSGSVIGQERITKVVINGNVLGGDALYAGSIAAPNGVISSVSVGGHVQGGDFGGTDAGAIIGQALGTVAIYGDLYGYNGPGGGSITSSSTIGKVTIGGAIVGGRASTGRIAIIGTPDHPKIGNVTINGSVYGGTGDSSGGIYGTGVAGESIGAVKVGGDWSGGNGASSGQLNIPEVASITLGGSLEGSTIQGSAGYWHGTKVGAITIGGNLVGGNFSNCGAIDYDSAQSIHIAGSILGGTADFTGSIQGDVKTIVIGHDIRGGDITSTSAGYNGAIAGGNYGSIIVGGSLIAGHDNGSGSLSNSGAILGAIGSLTIKGSVVGNPTNTANIQAPLSIKSINIAGRVEFGQIAVFLRGGQLGSLTVGGDWIASDVIVGLAVHSNFGNGSEALSVIPGGNPAVSSKVGSISIAGQVFGTADPSRTFGFGAEEIGAFKAGGVAFKLAPGKHNDTFAGTGLAGSAVPVGTTLVSPATMSDVRAVHVFEV